MKSTGLFFFSLFVLISCISCKVSKTRNNNASTKAENVSKVATSDIDTTAFVKKILGEKSKYLNKEFSILLDDLLLPIKSFSTINSNLSQVDGVIFSFHDRNTLNRKTVESNWNRFLVLMVHFKTPIPMQVYREFVNKNYVPNSDEFRNAEREFYSRYIVRAINSD